MDAQEVWDRVMVQYLRRNAESHANMFVVNATTPAQLFHVLRRQMNRPFLKPLVLFTPKFLLHHRPASSALEDFTTGTFFNRIIDDSKVDLYALQAVDMFALAVCSPGSALLSAIDLERLYIQSLPCAYKQQGEGLAWI